jgi:hypothetical protein
MFVDREKFMAFPGETTDCLKSCGVENVEFKTDFTDELLEKPISEFLPFIVGELTDNCADKGAKNIYVTLTDTSLRVEDDFIEDNPEKTLESLNKILITRSGATTKDKQRVATGCKPDGGMGIANMILRCLEQAGGKLRYFINGGKIVAEATWE